MHQCVGMRFLYLNLQLRLVDQISHMKGNPPKEMITFWLQKLSYWPCTCIIEYKSVGMIIPNLWKNKIVPNHQRGIIKHRNRWTPITDFAPHEGKCAAPTLRAWPRTLSYLVMVQAGLSERENWESYEDLNFDALHQFPFFHINGKNLEMLLRILDSYYTHCSAPNAVALQPRLAMPPGTEVLVEQWEIEPPMGRNLLTIWHASFILESTPIQNSGRQVFYMSAFPANTTWSERWSQCAGERKEVENASIKKTVWGRECILQTCAKGYGDTICV